MAVNDKNTKNSAQSAGDTNTHAQTEWVAEDPSHESHVVEPQSFGAAMPMAETFFADATASNYFNTDTRNINLRELLARQLTRLVKRTGARIGRRVT